MAVGYVSMTVTPSPSTVVGGGPSLPTAALVCKFCGNTRLINLKIAGVVTGA